MKNRIIYQLFLRPFTPEGTLAAAKEKLEHIASLGIDTIYLTSCCKADSDDNEAHFSPRQKASKTGNPKNPYRISDYYALDEEYGTIDDLSDFVNTAHALGLEVLFDVVFLHCGPNAVFLEDHPDFVKRDADGNIVCNAWCFPEINFDSPSLRRYLIDNMKYWIKECDFDGFRCDVGDQIPLDFWEEANSELKAIKPSIYMLNEGVKPKYLSVFDSNYSFLWTHALQAVIRSQKPASFLRETDEECRKTYGSHPYITLRALETHDYANDHYDNRPDKALPAKMVDCAHIINFMMDGIPFIYNGNEIADGKRHSIWSNREYGGMRIDWSNAYSEVGKARIELMKRVIALRRSNDWLFDGKTLWIDSNRSDRIAAFVRKSGDNAFLVLANFSDNSVFVELSMPFDIKKMSSLISRDIFCNTGSRQLKITANSYGFAIISLK
jgi:glycosidase